MKVFAIIAIVAAVALGGTTNPFAGYTPQELERNVWVVLAAGSNGYSNYRHQADVCHAYQVMHKLGIPDEHIIVFMYDDIANSASNPRKGTIINEPNGPDVYAGVPKDYTGRTVSTENFLKVLTGTDMTGIGSGKTLKSTKDDHVLVFFDDHGARGGLCFPEGCTLTGPKIETALKTASSKGLFGKLVFYVEACFAGSVFYRQTLPANVYVATASPVAESSFAYNWDSTIRAYVADIFSYLFIHDTEFAPMTRNFDDQYVWITENIENYSQACQYGDKKLAKSTTFGAFYKPNAVNDGPRLGQMPFRLPMRPRISITDAVPEWDVPYETARRVYLAEPTAENLEALKYERGMRVRIDNIAQRIAAAAVPSKPYLATPPCTTCDKTCTCYKYCISGGSAKFCEFECCNEQSCYEDPPKFGVDAVRKTACENVLTDIFLAQCGNDHAYLRSAERTLLRVCKDPNADLSAALRAIYAECEGM